MDNATPNPFAPRSITIIRNGIKFRRYPRSQRRADRVYYTPGIADKQRGVRRLHEEIWMEANGRSIPRGYHVHHIDENPLNNDPANLQLLSRSAHHQHHGSEPAGVARAQAMQPLGVEAAKTWHATPEGHEWHSRHGIEVAANRPLLGDTCEQCGKSYQSKQPVRFCSNACKSAWRRASGIDNVERSCEHCGRTFIVNKYSKQRFCSRSCGRNHGAPIQ